jgi:hypothetical protein
LKRYWAAGAFAIFIVVAIGTYYIQISMNRLPEFRLERLEGDPAEAANLVLKGNYRADRYNRYTDQADISAL